MLAEKTDSNGEARKQFNVLKAFCFSAEGPVSVRHPWMLALLILLTFMFNAQLRAVLES